MPFECLCAPRPGVVDVPLAVTSLLPFVAGGVVAAVGVPEDDLPARQAADPTAHPAFVEFLRQRATARVDLSGCGAAHTSPPLAYPSS